MLDSQLLDTMDVLPAATFTGNVWRVTWATRDPLLGGIGGGRWSPANSFETLYTSATHDGAMAEAYYHLSRAPVFSSSTMTIHTLSLQLSRMLTLTGETLQRLGIDEPLATRVDYDLTQAIGDAAHMLDYEGIFVPSARADCVNAVLFLDAVDVDRQVTLVSSAPVNWPAWRQRQQEGRLPSPLPR